MPVLDATFNLIVAGFAPARILYSAHQFADFQAMREDFHARGVLTVNVNHSEGTIFGSPATNWLFRAWHDAAHLATNADFSQAGERAASAYQIAQVFTVYGFNKDTSRWAALIDCEVNAQADYFFRTGAFLDDQFAFTLAQLRTAYGLNPETFLSGDKYATARAYRAATIAALPAARCDTYGHVVPSTHALEFSRLYVAGSQIARDKRASMIGENTHTCPDTARGPDDVVGCGKNFTASLDSEGLVDCPHCGMFFRP
jgi:hypothetical protein